MNNLRIIRAKKRITQWQLRLMSGVNQTKISMAENDLLELTTKERCKIAKALGVTITDVWEE